MEEVILKSKLNEVYHLKKNEWKSVQSRVDEVLIIKNELESLRKEKTFQKFKKIIKALNNSTRIEILMLIDKGITCACELEFLTELAQATISRHLSILEDVNLIKRTRKIKWVLLSSEENKLLENLLSFLHFSRDENK
ncbi:MAG: ArsR/SmtB family transcription factor [Promethearchaeota archaeon]|jgi:DNA-binding transcriptional ArsR family regulator